MVKLALDLKPALARATSAERDQGVDQAQIVERLRAKFAADATDLVEG